MEKDRKNNGLSAIDANLPDAGTLIEAQRVAAENASRMASAAWHYALSFNQAWIEFWGSHMSEYMELPKRLACAQAGFMMHAMDGYKESVEKFSGPATQVRDETEAAMRETEKAGERAARQYQAEVKDMARGAFSNENAMRAGAEERQDGEQPRGVH